MKVRLTAMWAIVALLVGVMPALAQVQTRRNHRQSE